MPSIEDLRPAYEKTQAGLGPNDIRIHGVVVRDIARVQIRFL